jgi:HK97 family phage major capsid protein
MTRLNTLREERAAKIDRAAALSDKAEKENRDLDAGERAEFDAIKGDVSALEGRIQRAEQMAEWERRAEGGSQDFGARELRHYSLAKAITEGMDGSLSGLEREVHAELSQGRKTRGVMVPASVIMEGRALTTTTPSAGPGAALIGTQLAAMTDRRRPALMVEALGATVLAGLTGNVDLPRLTGSGTASWVAEHEGADRSDAKFAKKSMGPKTVTAEYEVSRRMLLQSATALDPILRADLAFLLAQALDAAAIKGGGTDQPIGILSDTGVTKLTGGPLSSDLTADLIGALDVDDVSGTRAFLTHPNVIKAARKIKETGTGRVIPMAETFHNERVEVSTQVPATLGTAPNNNKAGLIYGEWASLYVGYWSGVDILMNPYHGDVASKGGALLHAFLDCDVTVRHPEGFRWMEIG